MKFLGFFLMLWFFALPCLALELPVGKWSGSYNFSEDEPLQVKYKVEKQVSEDEPLTVNWKITMIAAGVAIDFSNVQLVEDQLKFRMNPGQEVDCLLKSGEGGVYRGECRSAANPEAAQFIRIFMRPPISADVETEGSETTPESDVAPPEAEAATSADQPT